MVDPSPADARARHVVRSLPAQPGPLIGRADDVARLLERLQRGDVRLLSLIGPAGTGKTRLAVAAAADAAARGSFADGAWFVDLSPVRDPALVPSAIAEALDIREDRDRPILETVKEELASRNALVVLDNFEQVLPAATYLSELLRACAEVTLLVTSRSALQLRWEHEQTVSPLAVPDLDALPSPEQLAEIPAVALFADRTRRVDADFKLDETNARTVAEICVRLDGLPLAIELAAARTRVLPPRALLSRLGRRLEALGSGPRDQPARQRTLRAALDWSYELLSPPDRALFRRLGIFVGGFALEALSEVCDADGALDFDPVHAVESLIEKSLLKRSEPTAEQEPRLSMLETIREYALEQLDASGERETLRRRHATYYLAGADVAVTRISSTHQAAWLRSLDVEHDNLRAALDWCIETREPDLGLRAGGLLAWFWHVRGHVSEGRARLSALLAVAQPSPPALRAEGLRLAAWLALSQAEDGVARALYEESLGIRRQLDDPAGSLGALSGLGYAAMRQGDDTTARACFEEALIIQHRLDDRLGIAESLNSLANLAHIRGNLSAARDLYEQSQQFNRLAGYRLDVVDHNLGVVAQEQGDLAAAREYFESSVAARRAMRDTPGLALTLSKLGEVLAAQGDVAAAHDALAESIVLQRDLGDLPGLAFVLERMAMVAAANHQPERALRLAGASSALREQLGTPLNLDARTSFDARLAPAWQALKGQAGALAWQDGHELSTEAACQLALEPAALTPTLSRRERESPRPSEREAREPAEVAALTPREREVAALIAGGMSNREIARTLVIAERTADAHVSNILNKLKLNSRAQLAVWAVRHGVST